MQELVARLNELCDAEPFRTHWHLRAFKTGEEANRDGDVVLYSASTRKVAVMMAMMNRIHKGEMSFDQPFVIEEKYQNTRSGCFGHLRPGFEISLYDAIVMMIIVSDNACTGKIVDMLGFDQLNEYLHSIGMTETNIRQNIPDPNLWKNPEQYQTAANVTTANNQGHLLNLIVQGSQNAEAAAKLGCTQELCALALEIMTWQKLGMLDRMLPFVNHIPSGIKVASKTGTGPWHAHDIGVAFKDDEPIYSLAVYTLEWPVDLPSGEAGKHAGERHVANLSRKCWDALAG